MKYSLIHVLSSSDIFKPLDAEAYSKTCQTSKMKIFVKIVITALSFSLFSRDVPPLDVWLYSKYTSLIYSSVKHTISVKAKLNFGHLHSLFRLKIWWSSLSQIFFKIDVLKTFAIFTGKHLSWRVVDLQALKKKEAPTQVFSCEYCEVFNNFF